MNNILLVEKELDEVVGKIQKFRDTNQNSNGNKKGRSPDNINVISLIGDRGFGKTTILEKVESKSGTVQKYV